MLRRLWPRWGLVVLVCGCAGDEELQGGKTNQVLKNPLIEVTPPGPLIAVAMPPTAGSEVTERLTLVNTGSGPLTVDAVALEIADPGEPAFRLAGVCASCNVPEGCAAWAWEPGSPMPALVLRAGDTAAPGADYASVDVTYRRPADLVPRQATVVIRSDSDPGSERRVTLRAEPGAGRLVVSPAAVRFDPVPLGAQGTREITLLNVGSDTLLIEAAEFYGSSVFTVAHGAEVWQTGQTVAFTPPVEVPVGQTHTLLVHFAPTGFDSAAAALILHTSDPALPDGVEVEIGGPLDVPCLTIDPATVDFGLRPLGKVSTQALVLRACGTGAVTIGRIALDPSDSEFTVTLPDAMAAGPDGVLASPWVVPVNGQVSLVAAFLPEKTADLAPDGTLTPSTATLLVESDSLAGATAEATLTATAINPECPVAVPGVSGPTTVTAHTLVQLRGDQSFAPSGNIGAWQWTVEQPEGSAALFEPAATAPNPLVLLDVIGTYRFGLSVADEGGTPGCWTSFIEVEVVPWKGLHVELVWDTAGDVDPLDTGKGAGADLDLHLQHPLGAAFAEDLDGDGLPEGWLIHPYDCYWGNRNPDWGSPHPLAGDDPSLDVDDGDGHGPEIATLSAPQTHAIYRIGVHVWDAWGYGPSTATVRVFIDGSQVWEDSALLADGDLWEAAFVDWNIRKVGAIKSASGGRVVIPDYPK